MALFLGLLSMLFGSLFMSLTVDTLGTTGNSFLMIYGLGLFVLGGLVLGSRKTKRVKKTVSPKLQGIVLFVLGLVGLLSSFFIEEIALVYYGSALVIFGIFLTLTKMEQLTLDVKPIAIFIYMITFGMVMVITTFFGYPNEDLRTFGFVQLMLGFVFVVIDRVKEIKPSTKQISAKAK